MKDVYKRQICVCIVKQCKVRSTKKGTQTVLCGIELNTY